MGKNRVIMKIESFSVKDGMLLLSVDDMGARTLIKGVVDKCEESCSGYIRLDMDKPRKDRSLGQNALWWSLCTEYGRYCGMSKDDVALGVKYRAMEEGLWEYDEVPFSKTKERIPKSTAEADTQEMATLINVLYRIAAEDGYTFEEDF